MVKEGTITDKALRTYNTNFEELPEKKSKKPIRKIRTSNLIEIMKDVKPRKYEELRTLFNSLFKHAIGCGAISHNPVLLIPFKRAERQTRDLYPKKKSHRFLTALKSQNMKESNKVRISFISSDFDLVSLTKKRTAKETF